MGGGGILRSDYCILGSVSLPTLPLEIDTGIIPLEGGQPAIETLWDGIPPSAAVTPPSPPRHHPSSALPSQFLTSSGFLFLCVIIVITPCFRRYLLPLP